MAVLDKSDVKLGAGIAVGFLIVSLILALASKAVK
jgi:hypothetical protein